VERIFGMAFIDMDPYMYDSVNFQVPQSIARRLVMELNEFKNQQRQELNNVNIPYECISLTLVCATKASYLLLDAFLL
jgi:hypothetical protein